MVAYGEARRSTSLVTTLWEHELPLTVGPPAVVGVQRDKLLAYAACNNFPLATGSMSMKVCIGVLP